MSVLSGINAIASKDFAIARSYRFSFVLSFFTVFWTLVSFRFISKLVNVGQFNGDPQSYFHFVVVGIAISGVLHTAATGAASAVRQDQMQGTLEAVLVEPASRVGLGLGWTAYSALFSLVSGLVTIAIAIPMGFKVAPEFNPLGVIVMLCVSVIVFTALGMLGASIVLATQQGGRLMNVLLAMMSMVSGALFPVALLPHWLQLVADVSPLTYALKGLRQATLGGGQSSDLWGSAVVLLVFAAVLIPVANIVLERALSLARRRGTLGNY